MKCLSLVSSVLMIALFAGCATVRKQSERKPQGPDWLIFDREGQVVDRSDLLAAIQGHQVILFGERHDDRLGHEFKTGLIAEVLAEEPKTAIAMEMFERNEQGMVDLYLQGEISVDSLIEITGSKSWGGSVEAFKEFYQPIVDLAKVGFESGTVLVAANAPKSYVRLARLENFEVMKPLLQKDDRVFSLPDPKADISQYREGFFELMGAGEAHGDSIDVEGFFRAQQIWDATMAESVLRARDSGLKVILLAGDFHIANEGGVTSFLHSSLAEDSILTISVLPVADVEEVSPEDLNRADFIVNTRQLN